MLFPNNLILRACLIFNDIGRCEQFAKIGNFNDNEISHHPLGEEIFEKWISQGIIVNTQETDIIRYVILFHGIKDKAFSILPPKSEYYIDLVSEINDIDNGCFGALNYINFEIDNDAKRFIRNNPNIDQLSVSDSMIQLFSKGDVKTKNEMYHLLNTYAEYILFALSLAIFSLNGKHSSLAKSILDKPCEDIYGNKYDTIMQCYKELLFKRLHPEQAQQCYNIFLRFYNKAKDIKP